MRLLVLLCLAVSLCSCGARTAPVTHGAIAVPPTAPGVSGASEDILAQLTASRVQASVSDYMLKQAQAGAQVALKQMQSAKGDTQAKALALSSARQEVVNAKTQVATTHAQVVALQELSQTQHDDELKASFDRFYWLCATMGMLAGFLLYEAVTKSSKRILGYASAVGVLAAIAGVMPSVMHGLIGHEALIQHGILYAGIAFLILHFKTQEKAEAEKFLAAIEHLASHLTQMHLVGHVVTKVEALCHAAWSDAVAMERAVLAKFHKQTLPSVQLASSAEPAAGKGQP